jgi:hypothetical protein
MAKKRTRAAKGGPAGRSEGRGAKKTASRRSLARARTVRFRDILTKESPRRVTARSRFEAPVPHAAAAAPRALSTAAAVDAAAALTFVAVVTHDGPWELRSLLVNDFQILDTTILSTDLRIDVPIPSVFGSQLAVNWSILAGHLIPGLATFIEPVGQDPVKLAEKAPLKKGESWTPPAPSTFP